MPIRNDDWLNPYDHFLLMSWLANIDLSLCTSTRGVINYMIKYATQAEAKSQTYREIAVALIGKLSPSILFQSLTSKTMNQLLGERDIVSQKICH